MFKLFAIMALALMLLATTAVVADEDAPKIDPGYKAIDWSELAAFLPEKVEGMKVSDVDGGTINMADPTNPSNKISYTNVERTYTAGDKEVILRITDTGFNQFLKMPFMMMMEVDGPDASIKNVEIKGYMGKVHLEKKKGKVTESQYMLLIGDRLLVMAEGNEDISPDDVKAMLEKMDLASLEKLCKKQ